MLWGAPHKKCRSRLPRNRETANARALRAVIDRILTKPYSSRSDAVGTANKSIAAMSSLWFRKNATRRFTSSAPSLAASKRGFRSQGRLVADTSPATHGL